MKMHFFVLSDPSFIITFLEKFKLARGTIHLHKEAALWVLPFISISALAMSLNTRIYIATHIVNVAVSVNTVDQTTQKKPLRSY